MADRRRQKYRLVFQIRVIRPYLRLFLVTPLYRQRKTRRALPFAAGFRLVVYLRNYWDDQFVSLA